jgi:hypothetical protein
MDQINDANAEVDRWYSPNAQGSPEYHFDDCDFQGSVNFINNQHRTTIALANPPEQHDKFVDAAFEWGKSLHAAQDFYSHSNWVDIGIHQNVDNQLTEWEAMIPYGTKRGMIIVQGDDNSLSARGYTNVEINGRLVTLYRGPQYQQLGLVTGTTYMTNQCPEDASLGHWDSFGITDGDWPFATWLLGWLPHDEDGLNKDHDGRTNFAEARDKAIEQTEHEWCRLLNLSYNQYGLDGPIAIYEHWVDDKDMADAVCSARLSYIPF